MDQLAVVCPHAGEGTVAKSPGVRRYRLEYWLHISLGLADHPQDVAGGCLLLELLLQLVEEARFLNGDDRLVGKRPKHGDLPVCEHRGLRASSGDCTDGIAVTKHRHRYDAAEPMRLSQVVEPIVWVVFDVRYVNCGARQHCTCRSAAAIRCHREVAI